MPLHTEFDPIVCTICCAVLQGLSHSTYNSTVGSYSLSPALLNWLKPVNHGPLGQSKMHSTLDFCPDQTSQEGIECTKT